MPTERDYDNTNISLRLRGAEAVRYWKVMDAAKQRNPYAGKTDVIRELLGLDEPHLITPEELIYFRQNASNHQGIERGGDIKLSASEKDRRTGSD